MARQLWRLILARLLGKFHQITRGWRLFIPKLRTRFLFMVVPKSPYSSSKSIELLLRFGLLKLLPVHLAIPLIPIIPIVIIPQFSFNSFLYIDPIRTFELKLIGHFLLTVAWRLPYLLLLNLRFLLLFEYVLWCPPSWIRLIIVICVSSLAVVSLTSVCPEVLVA